MDAWYGTALDAEKAKLHSTKTKCEEIGETLCGDDDYNDNHLGW